MKVQKHSGVMVFDEIRKAILNGEYVPRERLVEAVLAERYHVSRTLIREALKQLQAIGLVTIKPYKGATVADMNMNEIKDVYVVRATLEGLAARLAAQHAKPEDLDELDHILKQMEDAIARWNNDEYHIYNRRFHDVINHMSGNAFLEASITELYEKSGSNRVSGLNIAPNHPSASVQGHREIYEALCDRDSLRAGLLAENHTLRIVQQNDHS